MNCEKCGKPLLLTSYIMGKWITINEVLLTIICTEMYCGAEHEITVKVDGLKIRKQFN